MITTTLMIQYQMLNRASPPRSKGSIMDFPTGGWSPLRATQVPSQTRPMRVSATCSQGMERRRKTMMTRKPRLLKTPWRKSVTMMAICPPRKTKVSAVPMRTTMRTAKVFTWIPATTICSGSPQKAMKYRAATPGKMP